MMDSDANNSFFHVNKVRRRARYVSFVVLFYLFIIAFIYTVLHKQTAEERSYHQVSEVANMKAQLISELNNVSADLVYYAHSEIAKQALSFEDKKAYSYLASLMEKISSIRKVYKQIRLFDNRGNEVIRFDLDNELIPKQVAKEQLQNKSERYYYKNTVQLSPNQIYISQFDLNIERGEITFPIEPMIRYATPIYAEPGKLIGAAVINFSGDRLLQIVDELNIHEGDRVHFINSDGYYLTSKNTEQGWGFMFPEKSKRAFLINFQKYGNR